MDFGQKRCPRKKPKSLFVRFFVRMDDVSKRILNLVNDNMTEKEREEVIAKEIDLIKKENSEDGKYVVSVKSFFQGNEYYYFVYQDYTDVRLVGTPPESIGKFGGDTDNWEWKDTPEIFLCLGFMGIKMEILQSLIKKISL